MQVGTKNWQLSTNNSLYIGHGKTIDIERMRVPISLLARHWSKISDFSVPTSICLPRLGDPFQLSPIYLASES